MNAPIANVQFHAARPDNPPGDMLPAFEHYTPLRPDWGRMLQAVAGLGPATFATRNAGASLVRACGCRVLDLTGTPWRMQWSDGALELFPQAWAQAGLVDRAWAGSRSASLRIRDRMQGEHEMRFAGEFAPAEAHARLSELLETNRAPREAPVSDEWLHPFQHPPRPLVARNAPDRQRLLGALGAGLARPIDPRDLHGLLACALDAQLTLQVGVAAAGAGQFQTGRLLSLEADEQGLAVSGAAYTFRLLGRPASAWAVAARVGREGGAAIELFGSGGELIAWLVGPREPRQRQVWEALLAALEPC